MLHAIWRPLFALRRIHNTSFLHLLHLRALCVCLWACVCGLWKMNNSLSMVEAKLPPGFRFHPKDKELVCDYLMKKVTCSDQLHPPFLIEVDLNKCEPWDIPETACVGSKAWYFYSQRDKKYATGLRTNRATMSGYWKATGKDRPVSRKGSGLVGMRKTLVFYQGRAPKGRKTDWVMHEFRLEPPLPASKVSSPKEDWVLCRVLHKNKEVAAKQATRGSLLHDHHHDTISSSSSLPPLMEPYITTFDQTPHHTNHLINNEYEQVPCFSIFNPNQTTSPTFSNLTHFEPNLSTTASIIPTRDLAYQVNHRTYHTTNWDLLGGLPNNNATQYPISISSSSCDDKKIVKAVLDHLTKMESNLIVNMKESPASFGEGSSEQSYLSAEERLPTIWNQQY